tara:strand:+ start:42 stop:197 length:156 start_codon:yes stop_codon:yes gene_type:complete
MTKKEFKKTDSKGREESWEWEETPEAKEAIRKFQKTIAELELKAPDYGVGK